MRGRPRAACYSRGLEPWDLPLRRLFRILRISLLMATLAIVAASTWLTRLRTTDWDAPLWVAIYPINGDGRATTAAYIRLSLIHI